MPAENTRSEPQSRSQSLIDYGIVTESANMNALEVPPVPAAPGVQGAGGGRAHLLGLTRAELADRAV
jgi:hypothetical protein